MLVKLNWYFSTLISLLREFPVLQTDLLRLDNQTWIVTFDWFLVRFLFPCKSEWNINNFSFFGADNLTWSVPTLKPFWCYTSDESYPVEQLALASPVELDDNIHRILNISLPEFYDQIKGWIFQEMSRKCCPKIGNWNWYLLSFRRLWHE